MASGGGGGSGGGGNRRICFEWRDKGTCRFGVNCVFAHTTGSGGGSGSNSSFTGNNTNRQQKQQQQGGSGSSGGGGRGAPSGGGSGSSGGGRGPSGGGERSIRGGRGQGRGGGRLVSGGGRGRGGGGGGSGRGGMTMGRGSNHHQQQHQQLQRQPDDVSRNIERFIQHLSVLSNSRLGTELIDATKSELWLNCWKRHSGLSKSTRHLLVQVLARLPESANVPPPSMPDEIVPVLIKFIQEQTTTSSGNSVADPDVILTSITTVRNVVKRCVQFEWPNGLQSSIKNGLETIIVGAENRLLKQSKDHRLVASDLMQELEYLEKPWRIRIQESIVPQQRALFDNTNSGDNIEESAMWKDRPTIGWLKNASHFTPSSCPIMSRGGVYESSQEYLETIHKLWTAMTFYDGHAACAPTCRARGSGAAASCGNVLWPVAARGGGNDGPRSGLDHLTCRRQNCTRPVDFCCSANKSHDALCALCASRTVAQRLGPPGPAACTHIYDATVEAVHPDGILQLEKFRSRRPPEKPIHWRSTKRLASPNLVAIIKIPSRGAALQDNDAIRWGEVTTFGHSDFRQEGRLREQGKVKINIASIQEWDGAHDVEDVYPVATQVAIIDCMIFCPEWIPTLRALESMKRSILPFEDGRHLNLCRTNPIVPVLLDISSSSTNASSNEMMVEAMLEASQLEPIREIRRGDLRSTLATRLVELMDESTLDPMQCQAFLKALCNPVHLTQGPPGTGKVRVKVDIPGSQPSRCIANGWLLHRHYLSHDHLLPDPFLDKSYLGVVLVRALIIIRELWMKTSRTSGAFPILVLSYKNHAIDEFLSDLVTSPSLRGGFGSAASSRGLIRIGGQCKDPRLAAYSERAAYEKDPQVAQRRAALQALLEIKTSINATLTSNATFFLHYQHRIFASGDEQEQVRRQAAYEATYVLMESIVRRQLLEQALAKLESDVVCNTTNNGDDQGNSRPSGPSCNEVAQALNILKLTENQATATGPMMVSPMIQRHVSNPKGNSFISQLAEGMAHYQLDHWGDVLERWITGVSLRPLCQFNNSNDEPRCCKTLAMSPNPPFCHVHRCHFQSSSSDGDNVERCSSPCAKEGVLYCRNHTCREEDCLSCRRAAVDEDYCHVHACRKCVETGKVPAGLAMDDPPRNTCEKHPLCVILSCLNFCQEDGNSMYCPAHETVQCAATTKKGNICKGQALDRSFPYCKDHLHLASTAQFHDSELTPKAVTPAVSTKEYRNCHATNKKGNPCKGTPLPGQRYCYDHAALETGNSGLLAAMAPKDAWCRVVSAKHETATKNSEAASKEHQKLESSANVNHSESKDTKAGPRPSSAEGKNDGDDDKSESADSFFSAKEENTPAEPDSKLPAVEADEMEWENEDEENEHAVHLREVFEVNNGMSSDSDDDLSKGDESNVREEADTEPDGAAAENQATWGNSNAWNWDMTLTERWSACNFFTEALLHDLRKASSYVKSASALARKELEKAKVLAKTRVYENKTVIGGTMVGCISRLEAIRASRPFAVLIEEASEVLEPLLFSCLSESTMTLQLVGDHRQLQPSVMDRFDFERRNKINVSMFQRLIEAPSGHEIPSTVLSVQRRMRRNIADLTRSFYTDVTQIEDHESCATQVLGRNLPPGSANLARTAATGGREIPGIGPHVFLWTHDGVQQRSDVGVSRVNKEEASRACALVAYLVECGVSRRSICVLTPYKGQLMLIRKMLLTDARYAPMRLISSNPHDTDVCRLSTVDRFQGDEADIVICSLVVDEKSRTGFVKLVNRMVVLLSRARLGSYILGNVGYFESKMPDHWAKTFEMLQSPADTDSEAVASSDVFSGIRTGASIPLCCPLHRNITHQVATAAGLRTGFCTEVCHTALICGHECSLKCHWPGDKHNDKCVQSIESPCDRHAGKLECHDVFGNAVGVPFDTNHESIVKYFKCPTKVELQLPCGHSESLPCWEEAKIVSGERPWPRCGKPSPTPYTFPSCGHTIPVSCHELNDFRKNPTHTQCERDEDYAPPCGHVKRMKCFMKEKYDNGDLVFTCSETESAKLPRCGHIRKLRCGVAREMERWSGKQCEEIGKVQEGVVYGPQDHICNKNVTVSRLCGHDMKLPCNEAFLKSHSMPACRVLVDARNNCGHACKLICTDFRALGGATIPEGTHVFKEGQVPPRSTLIVNAPRCTEFVQLERRCGHVEEIQCHLVNSVFDGCVVDVDIKSPLCGHDLKVPCCWKVPHSLWPDETYALIGEERLLSNEVVAGRVYSSVSGDLEKALKKCRRTRDVELQCGHVKTIKCCMLLDTLRPGRYEDAKCEQTVSLELECGHKMNVPCFQRRFCQTGRASVACTEMTVQDCWNHALCGKSLQVACGFRGTAACKIKSLWTCPAGLHSYEINHCVTGAPLDCPGCSMARIDKAISGVCKFTEPEVLQRIFQGIPNIQWCDAKERNGAYLQREGELLSRYKGWLDSPQRDIWARPVFKFHRVAIFKVLKGKKEEALDSFNSHVLINQAFNGIHVTPLTAENLTHLSANSSSTIPLTLFVGFVSMTRTKKLGKDSVPKKRNEKRQLVISLRKDFYDSLLFTDQKGFKSLIVWEPFPLVEVCKVTLTPDQLLALLKSFSGPPVPDLEPAAIRYQPPPNGLTLSVPVENSPPDTDDDVDDDDSYRDDKNSQALHEQLFGTILEGFDVDLKWSGGISSNGAISTGQEKDLLQKMQFATPEAAPFSAIKMLRTLMGSKSSDRILHLLAAAEMLGRDQEKARESLVAYLKESMAKGLLLHPWALIVAARLETSSSKQLLSIYLQTFPLQERYLTHEEIDQCRSSDVDSDDGSTDASEGGDRLQQEWDQFKADYPHEARSDSTEKLLNLVGLRKVKMEVLRLWKYALQMRTLDEDVRNKNMSTLNYTFLGNPGVGKTSVARLFSEMLCDCGLRSNQNFVEKKAQELKDGGSDEFRKTIQSAMGGVLFIDEAYDLDPVGDFKGKPIVNEILTLCENERDNISVVLAGYEDEFQKKFFAYNDGLKSRFKELMFDDFDENELGRIWTGMRKERHWEEDDGVCSVAVKRMVKMSDRKGFGNAREVRKRLEAATQTAMTRLGDRLSNETMRLEIEDVIGKDPRLESEKLLQVIDELESKIGWSRVKKTVGELLELCSTNYQRELLGKKPFDISLNRLFLGNPGTGKTSCAKIYGRLLKELGFLSHGDVVCKVASDFVGSVVGESQKKTSQIIEAARGKVLVIDEAYALDDNLYGAQVLDTLVERVQGTPADDIAVLLLGYEEDMQKMLKNQNPGLLRRFNPDYAFVFDDFNDHELLNILEANLKSYETKASIEFMEKALDVLQNQRLQTNFGNAGAVDLLVKGAVQKAAKRFGERPEEAILQECDIPDASCGPQSEDPLSDLDKLYKMETVKEKLDGMRKRLEVARREGDEAKISLHFVFRGSPGTGKTTVARALANILFGLKLKPTPKIVETTGLDLMANYVGQTATKTTEKLKESKGGILFIDEAYNLGVGTYGKEALDTLLAAMTSPDYEDVSIVIAGYPDELNQMMTTNPGMKSRFTEFIDFEDWDVEDCASFFKLCSSQKNFELESGVVEAVRQGCSTIRSLNGWGNGRDVRQLFTESKGLRDKRVYDTPNVEKTLALADVQAAIQGMIQARIPGALFGQDSEDPLSELDKLYKMEKVKDKLDGMRKKLEVAQREGDDSTKVSLHFVFRGAPGTGKTTVARAIAKVLFGLKLKPSPKIVETTGLDLMADYVGQTSTKTTAKLKESKGGVLFIDEAYNLGGGTYGKEALDTLLAAMTSPNYEDVCIVIAGYPVELDEMMSSNPGLKSRFTDFIEFEDWDADDCVSFIDFLAEKKKFELSSGVKELIHAGCSKLRNLPGWANGRDVAKLWTDMQGFRAQRVYEDTEAEPAKTLTSSDVKLAVEAMLNARTVPLGRKRSLNDITPPISPLASINHYYAQRGQGASESQHRQDQKHQPPSAAIQPLEQSATSAPQQQEGGSTPTRAQEEVAPGMDTCQTQAVEELREFQEMTCEYDDSDTTGAGGKHNGGDDILFVGRDEGVADEDWEELETAKEQERLRIDELRRQREENDRLLEEAKKAEEEARRMYEEELERVQKQMEREERERARREAWEKEERRRLAAEEKQRRLEAEARRLQEEERKQQEMQRRLQQIRLCPAGFNWFKSGCGWRCGGGSHYVSDSELRQQFGVDL